MPLKHEPPQSPPTVVRVASIPPPARLAQNRQLVFRRRRNRDRGINYLDYADLNLLPGGHQEDCFFPGVAVAASGSWWLGFDRAK